jgi:hypothetical protein
MLPSSFQRPQAVRDSSRFLLLPLASLVAVKVTVMAVAAAAAAGLLRCALCNTIMACKGERKTASRLGLDLRTLISVPQTSQ